MPYAQTSDIKIYYEVIDLTSPSCVEPQTIVFHHGIGADPGIWRDWLPLLIDRYKVVIFDMRGYGRSVDADKNITYSLNILTDDVLNVIDEVGADKVHLVGESIGGTIGLHFAIQYPERINTLTISNGGHVGSSIENSMYLNIRIVVPMQIDADSQAIIDEIARGFEAIRGLDGDISFSEKKEGTANFTKLLLSIKSNTTLSVQSVK